ncbi:hypothetical protein RYH73_06125 [Olivibacter sp. CPCC 100613]|uniref:hypothetical protein n=1 Tax=Olivibacter sp. CPCC 100613 TaxID=3079931 RepID=UPI002FFB9F13
MVTVGISLYSTRLILSALGVVDFGIFNLIAGIIALLAFVNNAMSTSTQRYLSFYQGAENKRLIVNVFRHSYLLHLIIGISMVVILGGLKFILFGGFLNIPVSRLGAAVYVYYFMIITVFFNVISVPFVASLTAHENMLWVAVVACAEVLSRLAIALLLLNISEGRLEIFAALTALTALISFLMYAIFCIRRYYECSLHLPVTIEVKLMKELSTYAGWNLFGTLCFLGRTQGLAVLLNLFLGSVVNAAYAIANQVTAQLSFFSTTMLRSLNPQIMKSEGAGDRERMLRLALMACKFGFLLLAMIAIPALFEMAAIMRFWLKNVPPYTVVFCQLVIIATLINQLTVGLQSAIQATGNIKAYQSLVGTLILLNLPLAYILLLLGFSAESVLKSYCLVELIACGLRLNFARKLAGLSERRYLNEMLSKLLVPIIGAVTMSYFCTSRLHEFPYRFVLNFSIIVPFFCVLVYFFSLDSSEKKLVNGIVMKIFYFIKIKWDTARNR